MLNGDGNVGRDLMRDENMGKMVQNGGDGNTAIRDEERNGVVVKDYEKETRIKRYKEERRKQLEQVAARVDATATTIANATTTTGRENRRLQGQTPNSPRRFITRPKSTTPNPSTVSDCVRGDGSSGSDGLTVRTTRASRLRAARVNAADNNTANKKLAMPTIVNTPHIDGKERSPLSLSTDASCASLRISRQEKDKSSKRKSNLNRSLNTEEVPSPDSHDDSVNSRRRRRRVLNPSDILVSLNESGLSSSSTSTSARVTPLPSPSSNTSQQPVQSQPRTPLSTTLTTTVAATASPRRSELRIHMENARRGVISSDCATKPRQAPISSSLEASTKLVARQMVIASWDGTPKTNKPALDGSLKSRQPPVRRVYTSSSRQRNDIDRKKSSSEQEEYYSLSDREFRVKKTGERKASSSDEKVLRHRKVSGAAEFDNRMAKMSSDCVRKVFGDKKVNVPSASKTNDISKRMDELTAFTRETLARVERLTNRGQLSPRREIVDRKKSLSKSPEKVLNRNNRIADNKTTSSNEKLSNSVQASIEETTTSSSSLLLDHQQQQQNGIHDDPSTKPSSILKKKLSQEEPMVSVVTVPPPPPPASVHIHGPVSILKRKSSHDEAGSSSNTNTSSFTTPVTFSPTVVDPTPHSRKKPGILKKRCSLDESHVIRRRSYSPDVALVEGSSDYRPILKNQRRSSLEEIIRTRSPDIQQPQGILKRKHSRGEEEFGERSLGSPEPQSILKRKSGTSSSGSSGNSPHVSIATAVILAAAGGAEIILEPSEPVKPILKKKSFSDENPNMDSLNPPEVPKPILKKKSSTETDDQDLDRPMKPILKTSRKCSQDDNYSSTSRESNDHGTDSPRYYSVLRNRSNHNSGESGSECETTVRPILKQSSSRENSPRPRLSFCNDNEDSLLNRSSSPRSPDAAVRRSTFVRRSNTVADADLSSIVNLRRSFENKEAVGDAASNREEPHVPKRPISVFEIVMNFEKTTSTSSTGAIPKRSSLKGSRNSGRFRTQPITLNELEATQILETVQNFQSTTSVPAESHTSPVRIQESSSPCSFSQKDPNSIGDLSHSLDLSTLSSSNNDSQLTTPSSMPNESADSGVASKMSFINEDNDKHQDCSREDDLSPQELCRSNSVSAKASMFKQLEAQMKAVAEEAKALRLSRGGNKGMQRYRNRKQAATCPGTENRFSTQPVTLDEVQEAVKANQRATESPDEKSVATADPTAATDEADPSKLSLAERVKLFNQKITQERLPVAPGGGPGAGAGGGGSVVRKPRQARFKTQPITSEEVETAQKISPLAASLVKPPDANVLEGLSIRATKDKMYEHAAKMLTSQVRGILKSKSAAISPVAASSGSSPETELNGHKIKNNKNNNSNNVSSDDDDDDDDDEGVSISISVSTEDTTTSSVSENISRDNKCKKERAKRESSNEKENNCAAADVETLNRKNRGMSEMKLKVDECMKELEIRNKVRRHLEEVQQMSSSDGTPQTSDGESSGGREVKRIISNDAVARRRQAALNRQKEKNNTTLVKSKSQSSIARDLPRTPLFSRSVHLDCSSGDRATDGAAPVALVRGGVRRSLTLPLRPDSDGGNDMPGGGTIADRLAELQNSGNNEWRKRLPKLNTANDELIQLNSIVTKNIYNDTLSSETISEKSSILAARKDKLETASQQWKKRVEGNDAINFSVAGRMNQESKELVVSPLIAAAQSDKKKKTPKAERFRGKESEVQTISTPVSPEKICKIKFTRSVSAPGVGEEDGEVEDSPVAKTEGRRVVVPRPDDETFTTFFESITKSTSQSEHLEVTGDDLDSVQRQSSGLLVTKKTVKVQRRHAGTARNPIKALAARSDIKEEYTEVITGVAEREKRRINVEKLAKHSSMAIEALAGLASKEDFTAISLKKGTGNTNSSLVPHKDLMLLHIKGRRHVQTRLVEPVASSINQGDNYVLVTPTQVYNYVGPYSNIIEQSRGAEIAQHIQQKKDLGCKCNAVVTIHEGKSKCTKAQLDTFWKLLGSSADEKVTEAGYPDEDEIYESAIILTNMVYELDMDNNELVPVEAYWGSLPKIEMLDSGKVLVFDFGSEMYIWSGRNVPIEQRREASKLAKQLWENGYNYADCTICPVNSVAMLGSRDDTLLDKKAEARPDWALICKITQHGETILFREKFLDWPDFSRVIKVKDSASDKIIDGSITMSPCDVEAMRSPAPFAPDLLLEGSHLGRGSSFFDEETNRHFEVATLAIKAWHILEYEYEELPAESIGQFYNGDSYIIRWQYMMTVTGRELSGKPSKHSMLGRDRCAYFCWQGRHAPLNEKGAAALLTVELDLERGPQVRVPQGAEPSAFLSLFEGTMTVHLGRRENEPKAAKRLYMCRGEMENEMHLIEVPCSVRQLRSRTSFLLISCKDNSIFIWHGSKSSKNNRNLSLALAHKIKANRPQEFQFDKDGGAVGVYETEEGDECPDFRELLGCTNNNRHLYFSLLKSKHSFEHTPRMFHLSSVSGEFKSNEIHCPHQSEEVTPYPFIQNDLYSASQPALFLIDNGHELWLWQGWWPETDSDSDSDSDRPYSGSGQHRWQAERRAAMRTALDYWQGPKDKGVPAYLVWAGLEPLEFTNLFPTWTDRDDIAELNIRDGRKPGELLRIENELARLTQSTYPLVQLLQRPLPEGVEPSHLEDYLSCEDFVTLLGMTKPEFQKLPTWKQTNIKKDKGLF